MINDKRVLVVVPARGGSKGIKLKNITMINGKTLMSIVADVVKRLHFVDRAVVSTDHPEIARIAKSSGLDVPFMRPDELSGDYVSDIPVLTHALFEMEKIDKTNYDIIIMLQPTSPLRTPDHVTNTVIKLIEGGYDSVMTVSETDSKGHPLKQLIIENDVVTNYDDAAKEIVARQQLNKVFHRNGVAYLTTRECLLVQKKIIGSNASAVIIDEPVVNIDTLLDFKWAELLFHEQKDK